MIKKNITQPINTTATFVNTTLSLNENSKKQSPEKDASVTSLF